MPFKNHDATGTPLEHLRLQEVGATDWSSFTVEAGFSFFDAQGVEFAAPAGMTTDLATIPSPLWGLLAAYGHQARAAVIHDHTCDLAKAMPADQHQAAYDLRRQVDYAFREALEQTQVSRLRAWLLWGGVSIGRYFGYRRLRGVLMLLGFVGWWAATVLAILGATALGKAPWPVAAAVLVGSAVLLILAGRSDWNLMAFGLAAFPLIAVVLVVYALDLVVQLLIYGLSQLVRLVFRGAPPVIPPTLRRNEFR